MTIGQIGGLAAILLALAVLLPFVNGARRKATLELVEKELEIERAARKAQEERCRLEIAELRGRVQVLTEVFAGVIAHEVVKVLRKEKVIP